jgi:hypothetical protein
VKRYLKWWVVLLGALVVLSILIITLGRGDTSKNRRIASDLLELNRQWPQRITYSDKVSLFQSLTNLPFHDGGASTAHRVFIHCQRAILGMQFDEFYWLDEPETNLFHWTLYHGWYWRGYRKFGRNHTLLTLVETNTEMTRP